MNSETRGKQRERIRSVLIAMGFSKENLQTLTTTNVQFKKELDKYKTGYEQLVEENKCLRAEMSKLFSPISGQIIRVEGAFEETHENRALRRRALEAEGRVQGLQFAVKALTEGAKK